MPRRFIGLILILAAFSGSSVLAAEPQTSVTLQPGNNSTTLDFANGLYARRMYAPAISEYEKFIQANPASPDIVPAYFRLADSHYFSKDYAAAIGKFDTFIKKFPNDARVPIAWFRIATAHYYLKQPAPAVKIFQKLAKDAKDPTVRGGALFYMGKSYEAKEKFEKSVEIFQTLIKEFPQNEFATYAADALGDHYLGRKQLAQAVSAYQIAADRNMPAEIAQDARFKMAQIHLYDQDYAKARVEYEKLLVSSREQGDESPEGLKRIREVREKALMNLFYCDTQTEDLEAATKRFETEKKFIETTGHTSEVKAVIAGILLDKKNYTSALSSFEQIIADPATNKGVREKSILKKAKALALSGKKDAALAEIQNLLKQNPVNPAMVYFEKGRLLKETGNFSEAAAAFEAVSQKDSVDYFKSALFELGGVYLKAGSAPKAREALDRFIGQFRDDDRAPSAALQMIQIDLDAGNFLRAVDTATRLTKERPKDPLIDIVYYKLGVGLAGLKKFRQAAGAFKTVINEYPASTLYTESIYGAAASVENDGDPREAIQWYERIMRDSPSHPLCQDTASRLGYLYVQSDQLERASAFYRDLIFNKTAIKLNSDGIFWLLQYLLDKGDYLVAANILGVLPQRIPDQDLNHEINFFLGESSYGLKDYAKAVEYYSRSIQLKPEGAYVPQDMLGMGFALEAMNNYPAAEKNFTDTLRYDSEVKVTMRARFEIANLRLRTGDTSGAAKAFMLVAILYDDEKYTPLALYNAGECFTRLNQLDEAHKAFLELKNHYPKSEWAEKIPNKENF